MDRRRPGSARKDGLGALACDDRECGNGFEEEGLQMIAGENDQCIGTRFIQHLAEAPHRGDTRVELLGSSSGGRVKSCGACIAAIAATILPITFPPGR